MLRGISPNAGGVGCSNGRRLSEYQNQNQMQLKAASLAENDATTKREGIITLTSINCLASNDVNSSLPSVSLKSVQVINSSKLRHIQVTWSQGALKLLIPSILISKRVLDVPLSPVGTIYHQPPT